MVFSYLCNTNNTMKYTVFISLEPYLAQWILNESGGECPIPVKRGSAEADLLEMYLRPQPKDPGYIPQLRPLPGQVEMMIPWFKSKDVRTYNFLPPEGEVRIRSCIRNRFMVAIWKDLHTVGNVVKRNDITISTWMTEHGIEDNDTNWNTIAKILQRKRAVYCPNNRLTTRKTSKHKKKA